MATTDLGSHRTTQVRATLSEGGRLTGHERKTPCVLEGFRWTEVVPYGETLADCKVRAAALPRNMRNCLAEACWWPSIWLQCPGVVRVRSFALTAPSIPSRGRNPRPATHASTFNVTLSTANCGGRSVADKIIEEKSCPEVGESSVDFALVLWRGAGRGTVDLPLGSGAFSRTACQSPPRKPHLALFEFTFGATEVADA
jgi:hypothetical protein